MTIKQRKRRHARRRAYATGVSPAIGRPQASRRCPSPSAAMALAALREGAPHAAAEDTFALESLTVAKLQALAGSRGVEYRAKDRKGDLIAKIMAANTRGSGHA